MQFLSVSTLVLSVTFSLFSGAASLNTLVGRSPSSDYCGEVHAELRVPKPFSPGKYTDCGSIGMFSLEQSEYYAHSIISIRCLSLRIRCPSLHGHNPCCHSCCRDSWEVGSCSDTDGLGNSTCGTSRYFLCSADQKMCGIWTMSLSIAFSSCLYSWRSLWIYVQGRVSRISWTSQNGVD
jgi:hypothetical protein